MMSLGAKLATQLMTMFSRAFVAGSKEVHLLKKQVALLQENVKKLKQEANSKDKDIKDLQKTKEQAQTKANISQSKVEELTRDLETEKENWKKQYEQVVFYYIYTTLSKVPDFDFSILGAEAAEMAEAFHAMLPTQTQGCAGNLFLEEAETADAEEVADGAACKVADGSITPTA
uniref:Uncharacterized protein n=1 Tax=Cannabis sativa TaxID=3483 RepID=A0A803PBM7_CANSA